MRLRPSRPTIEPGFTLIELVITIVVVGIIAGVLFPVIYYGAESYRQQTARVELLSRGRMAMERITREVRQAVPNTVRISTTASADDTLEFGRSVFVSRYVAISGGSPPFTLQDNTGMAIPSAPFVVLYNTSPADYYAYPASLTTFRVTGVGANSVSFNAAAKPDPATKRYQLSSGPVTYAPDGSGNLTRYAGYDPGDNHVVSATDVDVLIDNVTSIQFRYSPGTLSNAGLVTILMQISNGDVTLDFHQEVHIRNVP